MPRDHRAGVALGGSPRARIPSGRVNNGPGQRRGYMSSNVLHRNQSMIRRATLHKLLPPAITYRTNPEPHKENALWDFLKKQQAHLQQ